MFSKIVITFNQEALNTESIGFRSNYYEDGVSTGLFRNQYETFRNIPRTGAGYIQTSADGTPVGSNSALNFATYWDLDYNAGGYYNVSVVDNVVTIEATDETTIFDTFTGGTSATAVITDVNYTDFTLVEELFLEADSDVCNKVKYSIETSSVADTIYINDTLITDSNVANPYIVELDRGLIYNIELRNTTGDYDAIISRPDSSTPFFVPKLLTLYFEVGVVNGLGGATVTVNSNFSGTPNPELELEYSLNNVDWDTSNVFTGQAEGDYTMYIRDSLGCSISIDYTVDEFGTRSEYIFISKANSIGFFKQEETDDCETYRNDTNSFAYQDKVSNNQCNPQLFNDCDSTTIQIHTSYNDLTVTVREENGAETNILVNQMTANLNRFKAMDCIVGGYYGPNQIMIYFESGNYYDIDGIDTGDDYVLNGNLPDFAIRGTQVQVERNGVDLGLMTIDDIVVVELLGVSYKAIICNYPLGGGFPLPGKIKALYNLLPFEVYQFTINWSAFDNGLMDVLLTFGDSSFDTVYYLSENICKQDEHENTVGIKYYNFNNRDIFYKYGIEHFIRLPIIEKMINITENIEININDSNSEVVNSNVNDGNTYIFEWLTRDEVLRLIIALNCEALFIDGIGYSKQGEANKEPIEGTNLSNVTVNLIKNGKSYTNQNSNNIGIDIGYEGLDLPNIITDGTNFIKE